MRDVHEDVDEEDLTSADMLQTALTDREAPSSRIFRVRRSLGACWGGRQTGWGVHIL